MISEALGQAWGNPSSPHPAGRRARATVELARQQVASLLHAQPDEIVFTSGGTESNNLALLGSLRTRPGRLLISAVEHPAVRAPAAWLASQGTPVDILPVDRLGQVSANTVLPPDSSLISVMLANNETGTLQPLPALAAAARSVGAWSHTDAAQAVGKIAVDVGALGVDLLTVAGHKLYAPKGVGALFVRKGLPLAPLLLGGGQEAGRRPGTEAVASIAGLGEACRLAHHTLEQHHTQLAQLRDLLWELLHQGIPGLVLHGHPRQRLPNTLNLRAPGVSGHDWLARVPELAASTGSACHEGGVHTPSPVLHAMGLSDADALGAVRLSVGRATREQDVRRAAVLLIAALTRRC